ncbi:VWA domain-containing protein [Shewanella sp. UCD-KL21]|uniref:VWA domain-containing protein n=1 Tax=Shewanella sp. UCD-KL21 TaxID=1917164 RepID=UPI000970507A|nr:VWA domain-containing protein [Shewanella sp. UCD-KL21]
MSLHFIRPEWLLALIPLTIIGLFLWRQSKNNSAWQHYIAPHLASTLISESAHIKKQPKWLLMLCWFIAVVAISGPAVNKQSLPVFASEQGRVLVMDMSLSMYATDQKPNRLSQAKYRATDFLTNIKEGETGLIAFAGDAFTISPLTRDSSTLLNLLPTLSPDIMPVRGSDLAAALTLAQQLLGQGGHISGDIIVMTDGVNAAQYAQAAKALDGSRYRVSVMAFGSQQGAAIQLPDGQLMRDNAGEIVVDKTDFSLLDKLVTPTGGLMLPARADGAALGQLEAWLANDGNAKATELEGEAWQDLGPYIALLLIIPVLLSFRFTVLPMVGVMSLGLLLQPAPASANSWDDLWQTADQQASEQFNQAQSAEDFSKAAEQFDQPQWQASAQYKAGDYENALSGFEQDDSAHGLYNQANSLLQLNKIDEAIERYKQALTQQADFPQAEKNLALAEQMKQQQEQQSDQDQDQQSDDNQSSDNQSSDKKSNDEQSSNDQSQGEQSQSDDSSAEQSQQQQSQNDPSQENQSAEDQSANDSQQQQQSSDSQQDDSPNETDESSSGSSQQNEQQAADNEAEMQANSQDNQAQSEPETVEQQGKTEQQAQAAETSEQQPESESGTPVASSALSEEPLPADLERALRAVSEDPQVLIRNKMLLEYQKRRQNGQLPKDKQQW